MDEVIEPLSRMQPYGIAHLIVLLVTLLAAIVLVIVMRRIRGSQRETNFLTVSGWITLFVSLAWMAWGFLPGVWDVHQSLPFHFSDALRIVTGIALITRAGWAISICYFWGLTLNLQSVLTPDLNYFQSPVIEFTLYWFLHIVALLAPIVLIWGSGFRPTWRAFCFSFAATIIWAGIAIVANAITGANYAYLARGPEGPSVLDVLGPWPIYILWEGVIIAVVWALMTWPWEGKTAKKLPYVDRLRTIRRSV